MGTLLHGWTIWDFGRIRDKVHDPSEESISLMAFNPATRLLHVADRYAKNVCLTPFAS